MSRIGKQLITIPAGVTVEAKDQKVMVRGAKEKLEREVPSFVSIKIADDKITVDVPDQEDKFQRAVWGTTAAHIKNMIVGVTKGFSKQLEVNGVGYRVALQGRDLKLELGFSHPVVYKMPEGVIAAVEKNLITLTAADKELLGRAAAEIRSMRKPEPYKGKGIKYTDEVLRRKAGKAAKAAAS